MTLFFSLLLVSFGPIANAQSIPPGPLPVARCEGPAVVKAAMIPIPQLFKSDFLRHVRLRHQSTHFVGYHPRSENVEVYHVEIQVSRRLVFVMEQHMTYHPEADRCTPSGMGRLLEPEIALRDPAKGESNCAAASVRRALFESVANQLSEEEVASAPIRVPEGGVIESRTSLRESRFRVTVQAGSLGRLAYEYHFLKDQNQCVPGGKNAFSGMLVERSGFKDDRTPYLAVEKPDIACKGFIHTYLFNTHQNRIWITADTHLDCHETAGWELDVFEEHVPEVGSGVIYSRSARYWPYAREQLFKVNLMKRPSEDGLSYRYELDLQVQTEAGGPLEPDPLEGLNRVDEDDDPVPRYKQCEVLRRPAI